MARPIYERLDTLEDTVAMLVRSVAALTFQPADRAVRAVPAESELNLKAREQGVIIEALRQTNGDQKRAAQLLGISPRVLSYKLLHRSSRRKTVRRRRLRIIKKERIA